MKLNLSVMLGALLVGSVLFTGCIPEADSEASNSSSSGLTVTFGSGGETIDIKWNRTGSVIYYSHTDLVASNSTGVEKIAGTNSSSQVSISCTKGVYSSQYGQRYSCLGDNEGYGYSFYLKDNETNYLEERGIYSDTAYGQKTIATLTSNGSGSYTVAYK